MIILMRGRMVTGGYPVVAVLTTPSVGAAAQARPGDRVRLSIVGLRVAREAKLWRPSIGLSTTGLCGPSGRETSATGSPPITLGCVGLGSRYRGWRPWPVRLCCMRVRGRQGVRREAMAWSVHNGQLTSMISDLNQTPSRHRGSEPDDAGHGRCLSDGRLIRVVVDPRGQLTELEIAPRIYRNPHSTQLSASILATGRTAVAGAAGKTKQIMDRAIPRDRGLGVVGQAPFDGLIATRHQSATGFRGGTT